MDLLLFPSRYEGLGIAAIEAQVRGLRVLASTNVPREAQISDGLDFLSLDVGAQVWAETALGLVRKVELRDECLTAYDISRQVRKLEGFYEEIRDARRETGFSR